MAMTMVTALVTARATGMARASRATTATVTVTTVVTATTATTAIKAITAKADTTTGRSTSIPPMPRLTRRAGTLGLALTVWDVWQRIPPRQRKQIVKHARRHGPKLAALLVQTQARRRNNSR
jgi:hypothetical protein